MTRNLCGRLLAICAVCVAVVTVSPSLSAHDSGTADALMLRLMSTHNGPGAALALIKNGSIVLDKGYGFRDLAAHAPVTTATLFNIGSISKSFTALGVTQLVDQHQLDLDAPVLRYIPDLRLSDPQATQAVTLRQLLSHTSGLPADEQWPQQVPATAKLYMPYHIALLAAACEIAGQIEEGVSLLDDALQLVGRMGECWFAAELNRHKGELLLRQGRSEAAEELYREALNVAKEQAAKLWELRAATSLARLWGEQGQRAKAHALLAPVYGWFTEGFDTADLKEAKAMLDELM